MLSSLQLYGKNCWQKVVYKNHKILKKIIYIILFLNILIAQDHWETAIFASDEWEYIVPNEEPLSNWNAFKF